MALYIIGVDLDGLVLGTVTSNVSIALMSDRNGLREKIQRHEIGVLRPQLYKQRRIKSYVPSDVVLER